MTFDHAGEERPFPLDAVPRVISGDEWDVVERCNEPAALEYVLTHMEQMVVKPVDGSGGKGLVIGPAADSATSTACALGCAPTRAAGSPSPSSSCRPSRP